MGRSLRYRDSLTRRAGELTSQREFGRQRARFAIDLSFVWDRLENLVRSWINAEYSSERIEPAAWEELESYLRDSTPADDALESGGGSGSHGGGTIPREIRQAHHDLEVPLGAKREEIRNAYRRLLRTYHPDRFHADPERTQAAGEITQRISLAYKRLNDYYQY